jgi:4'-phosphopantetheinyl transferase
VNGREESATELGPDAALREHRALIWLVDIEACGYFCERAVSPEERQSAEQIAVAAERRRFLRARGLLRELLARQSGCLPTELAFGRHALGKPFLRAPRRARHVAFSVSHSGARVAIALALRGPIGVDVEQRRALSFPVELGRWLASRAADGGAHFEANPSDLFRAWTHREARLKALGLGVAVAGERALTRAPAAETSLRVLDLDAGADYAAAVCVTRDCEEIEYRVVARSEMALAHRKITLPELEKEGAC